MNTLTVAVIVTLVGLTVLGVETALIGSTPEGMNLMFQKKTGYTVNLDYNLHPYAQEDAQNLTYRQFIQLLTDNTYRGCCDQSQGYWDTINPRVTMSSYMINWNHHNPQWYWYFTLNGTTYQWLTWEGNHA